MKGKLLLKNGLEVEGVSFGSSLPKAGELVFSTGMVGYPEAFTDPSFAGQILVLTYPIIGNYGVPNSKLFESAQMWISGLIVSDYIDTPSHYLNEMTLSQWLKKSEVPALVIKDTRFLTEYLRDNGSQLAQITLGEKIPFYDPNKDNLVDKVSTKKVFREGKGSRKIVLIDCGEKRNMHRCLIKRGVEVITVPWNYKIFDSAAQKIIGKFDGIVIANGPGDPTVVSETIDTVKIALKKKIPILGICLGHQILTLAAGGKTEKLKFGHRSQNQPCVLQNQELRIKNYDKLKRCFITTQNHGFAVSKIPPGFKPWFINANDNTNEGIMHEKLPFMSVQFHPEASPGPVDTEWIFDEFLKRIKVN